MIANPEVADVFRKRAKVNHASSLLSRKQLKPSRYLRFSFLCLLLFKFILPCLKLIYLVILLSRLYQRYEGQWNLLVSLKLKLQFYRFANIFTVSYLHGVLAIWFDMLFGNFCDSVFSKLTLIQFKSLAEIICWWGGTEPIEKWNYFWVCVEK